jgi:hypothetical protein
MVEHVNVTAFFCCDSVIEEARTGKKTIVGTFRNFHFQELPARFGSPWYIYAQISGVDPGRHDITVNIVHDETAGVVFAAALEIPEDHPEDIDLIIQAQPTQFAKPGKHVVSLNIDGTQVKYCVLNVELRKQKLGG